MDIVILMALMTVLLVSAALELLVFQKNREPKKLSGIRERRYDQV